MTYLLKTGKRNTIRPDIPIQKVKRPPSFGRASEVDGHEESQHRLLWKLMNNYIPATKSSVQTSFVNHIEYTIARSRFSFDSFSSYLAVSYSVRDRLIELFNDTMEYFIKNKVKQVYYISIEFLMGRFLRNALLNLELEDLYRDSLQDLGVSLDQIYDEEYDPGLGNGGLGRLAACFMDSLATLNYPAWGYGLMYSFGMFKQTIGSDGSQIEIPDYWLNYGDPWRVQKSTVMHTVGFYGRVEDGKWTPGLTILAVANDFLIPGYGTDNTLALRLWSSKPTSELDEEKFRYGDYYEAISLKQRCENLTSVLYPNDNTPEGKEMRLMQEYFMSSATLKDIVRRLKNQQGKDIRDLESVAAIQLNDTHPALMVAELLRILMDEEDLPFDEAYSIVTSVFSYTCHTLMPEALEKWPVPLFENLLPRHLQIIYHLNQVFLDNLRFKYAPPDELLSNVSIVEESCPKQLRMANLAVIGSHAVNGVATIHSELMKQRVFKDFAELSPEKFQNKTNGVTIRRWLHHCNPELSKLITDTCDGSEDWINGKAELLTTLTTRLDDIEFCQKWREVKDANKKKLALYIQEHLGIQLNPEVQLFDIQVKRIHEYKRQTLNVFSIIYRYLTILGATEREREAMTPRATIIGGKAAPGYYAAKKLIKLVNNVARVINSDSSVGDLLKVVFIPNYNVSLAEMIIPAADINQQISTAGTEASGTSNMKFAFNASLIVGTWDGANIEIGEAIGSENVFFFGAKTEEVDALRASADERVLDPKLQKVFEAIKSGLFGDPHEYECLTGPIEHGDHYLVNYDFDSYVSIQQEVDEAYKNRDQWVRMCIQSTANMARFSSDRTIEEYARDIWGITPCPLPRIAVDGSWGQPTVPSKDSIGSLRRHMVSGEGQAIHGSFGSLRRNVGRAPARRYASQQPDVPDDEDDQVIPVKV